MKMRPRKDGMGYSECSSFDEKVGIGRCIHQLSLEQPALELNRIAKGFYNVEIDKSLENEENINENPKEQDKIIGKFLQILDENKISEEKKNLIIKELEGF